MSTTVEFQPELEAYGPKDSDIYEHTVKASKALGSQETAKQYARIIKEYEEFATAVYGNKGILADRVFRFLTFPAHRPLRSVEGAEGDVLEGAAKGKRNRTGRNKSYVFSADDYKRTMDSIQTGAPDDSWEGSNKLKSIEKHYSALVKAASNEESVKIKAHQGIKTVVDNVNRRAKRMEVDSNSEKLSAITEKLHYPELFTLAEDYLWQESKGKTNRKYMTSSLRNRYTLLTSVQTCTRHEATV